MCGVRVEWRLGGSDACGIEEADGCWPLDGTARVGLDLLLYATTSVIPYVSSGARGAGCFLCGLCRVMPMVSWPLWFVMPCYAMVGWKSLISGDFPSDQGTRPEQQGTIWDKE